MQQVSFCTWYDTCSGLTTLATAPGRCFSRAKKRVNPDAHVCADCGPRSRYGQVTRWKYDSKTENYMFAGTDTTGLRR